MKKSKLFKNFSKTFQKLFARGQARKKNLFPKSLIFAKNPRLLSQSGLKRLAKRAKPALSPLLNFKKGLIKQTKRLISKTQHSLSATANRPQGDFIWT